MDCLEVIHHSASKGRLLLDMPKLPSLAFSPLRIGLEACLETRQDGGQSMNGLRQRR